MGGRDPTLGEVEECNSACEGEGTGTHTADDDDAAHQPPSIKLQPTPVCLVTLAP